MTSVAFSKDNDYVFCGGIDNKIYAINLRSNKVEFQLIGHSDTITDLSLSNSENYLLSNSMDNTLRIWDVRPYCSTSIRQIKIMGSHTHQSADKNLLRCSWN